MENEPINQSETMNCGISEQSEDELKADGWEETWSFHSQIPEQWNEACQKVASYQRIEGYQVALVNSKSSKQVKDGILLIFIKRSE